jgi:uncharacterized protein YraI
MARWTAVLKQALAASLLVTPPALLALPETAHAQWAQTCTRDPYSSVNLRSGPSRGHGVIASIPPDTYVRALTWVWGGDNAKWYRVEANGLLGWTRSDYLCR